MFLSSCSELVWSLLFIGLVPMVKVCLWESLYQKGLSWFGADRKGFFTGCRQCQMSHPRNAQRKTLLVVLGWWPHHGVWASAHLHVSPLGTWLDGCRLKDDLPEPLPLPCDGDASTSMACSVSWVGIVAAVYRGLHVHCYSIISQRLSEHLLYSCFGGLAQISWNGAWTILYFDSTDGVRLISHLSE